MRPLRSLKAGLAAANLRMAASSVAAIASGYSGSLRPCPAGFSLASPPMSSRRNR
jgi:hypothetical protein